MRANKLKNSLKKLEHQELEKYQKKTNIGEKNMSEIIQ